MLSPLIFFLFTFSLSFSLSLFLLYKTLHKSRRTNPKHNVINPSLSKLIDESNKTHKNDTTGVAHSILFDILSSDSTKWEALFENDLDKSGSALDECGIVKKKKKRGKKKKLGLKTEEEKCNNHNNNNNRNEKGSAEERQKMSSFLDSGRVKPELVCLYPFTSTSSATQRKIKQHYDQLVKCNQTKGLTLAQVGEFANCLIEARHELQQKSEVIKRKFTIKKALLFKADRSSIDRVRQQIYKLELEQKRLEEDAFVYNWLQQQLKLSPAYKKMLELSASMESEAKPADSLENEDDDSAEISFEELLAQEKKDAFWQKNGKSRTCSI